jgi:hypothetical protein
MFKSKWVIGGVFILLLTCLSFDYQTKKKNYTTSLMWYNDENLFYTLNDLSKNDYDFTPSGKLNSNTFKYQSKINNIACYIMSQSKELTSFFESCVIKKKHVINYFLNTISYLIDCNTVHYYFLDKGYINKGYLYNDKKSVHLYSKSIPVYFNSHPNDKTLGLIYLQYKLIDNLDNINILLAHFPSRRGRTVLSQSKRIQVADYSSQWMKGNGVDKYRIFVSDFNNQPCDLSISKYINKHFLNSKHETQLYKLIWNSYKKLDSFYYQGKWEKLEQFIISHSLFNKYLIDEKLNIVSVFKPNCLLKRTQIGYSVPFRKYEGLKWENGYDGHLPVVLKLN